MSALGRIIGFSYFTSLVLAAAPAVGVAGWPPRFHSDVDVDIDSLKAEVRYERGGWRLLVGYEIEIEDARPYERFELVLTLLEHGRPLRDRFGRPLSIVVPLDRPTKYDRDEVEFRRRLSVRLGAGAITNPRRLKILAEVVRTTDGHSLDHKKRSVKFRGGFCAPIGRAGWGLSPRWRR